MKRDRTPTLPAMPLATLASNLQRWLLIRMIVIISQLLGFAYAGLVLDLSLEYPVPVAALVTLLLYTLISLWRLRHSQTVSPEQFFIQLAADLLLLTVVFFYTGGSTNPFISWYLVPLIVAASVLPVLYSATLALLTLAAYTTMLYWYVPVAWLEPQPMGQGTHEMHTVGLTPHIVGMWFNFALSTLLISWFVVRMAQALREQQTALTVLREQQLRDEQLLGVATLAAGTAHELGTPLSTMSVLVEDLLGEDTPWQEDLQILQQQLQNCRVILRSLVEQANTSDAANSSQQPVNSWLSSIVDRCRLLRPDARVLFTSTIEDKQLATIPVALDQAILNLLDNGLDASDEVTLSASVSDGKLVIEIRDFGPGLSPDLASSLGTLGNSDKKDGLGLGLMLTHATVERSGGTVTLYDHPEGGILARIILPLGR